MALLELDLGQINTAFVNDLQHVSRSMRLSGSFPEFARNLAPLPPSAIRAKMLVKFIKCARASV